MRGGMDDEVVCDAIKRAALQGSPRVTYVEDIFKNWWAQGVRDIAGVERSIKNSKNAREPEEVKHQIMLKIHRNLSMRDSSPPSDILARG